MSTRIKHGRVLTKSRLAMIDAYERRTWRQLDNNPRLSRREHDAAWAWRKGFTKFMCRGWDSELRTYGHTEAQQDAQRHDPGLHAQQAPVDGGSSTDNERT